MVDAHRSISPWLILIAATGSLSMIMFDSTVVGVALPSIQSALHLSDSERGWIVSGYLLTMAACTAVGGRIGDRMGHVNAFRLGALVFAIASGGCAFATSGGALVAARVLQGLAVSLMQPAATALVVGSFPKEILGRVMGVYVGIPLLFLAAGPVLGGAITTYAGWSWIFLPNLIIAAIAIGLTFGIGLRNTPGNPRPFHPLAPIVLMVSLAAMGFGLQEAGDHWTTLAWSGPLAVCGLIGLVWFFRWQITSDRPLIAISLFRDRVLLRDALLIACAQFALVGQGIFGPIYLQVALQMSPLESGIATLPLLVPTLLMVHAAGRAFDRVGSRAPVRLGALLLFVGLLVEAVGMWNLHYPTTAVGLFFLGSAVPLILNPANTEGLSRAPEGQRGEVAGITQSARQLGSALGITVVIALVHLCTMSLTPGASDVMQSVRSGELESLKALEATQPILAQEVRVGVARGIALTFGANAFLAVIVGWLAHGLPRRTGVSTTR
ncbi:MAG: MFS transporter [Planctomycetota bacterium]|nr:MFS transporter [Planctomycetota bacterium]